MPPNEVSTVTLKDGRRMEYAEYGDAKGDPLLFYHGFIGSYHQASPAHAAAKEHGLRLIAPNRPGVGKSTAHETKTIVERMADTRQLLEALDIKKCSVAGVSGGVPYALAAAAVLQTRVKAVAAISGMGPISDVNLFRRMEPLRRTILSLNRFPWLVEHGFAWGTREHRSNPEKLLHMITKRWPPSDQELFREPALRTMFLADLRAVLHEGEGPKELAQELRRYFHWGFSLKDLPKEQSVQFWHGTDDTVVPHVSSAYMAKRLPNAEATFLPGGHFVIVTIIDEVMKRARTLMER